MDIGLFFGVIIFGFIAGMFNGGALHDHMKERKIILLIFCSIISLVFGFMIFSIFNYISIIGILIWIFAFITTLNGNLSKHFKIIESKFNKLFEVFGIFVSVVTVIFLSILGIFLIVKLLKFFWYL
jgi:predicted MFS family arabinose efflux permease